MLVRADDELSPVKLHASEGRYEDLPLGFRAVVEAELAGELSDLASMRQAGDLPDPGFHAAWASLAGEPDLSTTLLLSTQLYTASSVLTTTAWNQNEPYNYYAPSASGGPGDRAYAGCSATALAQILRYHRRPEAPLKDYGYTDGDGLCTGYHRLADIWQIRQETG